jgi:hypothetical protein
MQLETIAFYQLRQRGDLLAVLVGQTGERDDVACHDGFSYASSRVRP